MVGNICWFEIPVSVIEQSKAFYAELFSWTFEVSSSNSSYVVIINEKIPVGALYEVKEMEPSMMAPLFYFAVSNIDGSLETVEKAGGKIATDKTKLPQDDGWYAHIQDLDGNLIGIWSK